MNKTKSSFSVLIVSLCCLMSSCNKEESNLPVEDSNEPPAFQVDSQNPIFTAGNLEDWDGQLVFLPEVIKRKEKYYMFYTSTKDLINVPLSIGLATSSDGKNWKKQGNAPILTAESLDAFAVGEARILLEGDNWIMYFNVRTIPGPGPGTSIARAVATSPEGPWTITHSSILRTGGDDEWDMGFISPSDIIKVDRKYYLYYSGGTAYVAAFGADHRHQLGLATSMDGINFEKHNDPNTNNIGFRESDPVLPVGPSGSYDSGMAWAASVLPTTFGFEMFYTSDPDSFTGERICYATSADGKKWTKDQSNPILEDTQNWISHDLVVGTVLRNKEVYTMYYSGLSGLFDGSIGMATGSKP